MKLSYRIGILLFLVVQFIFAHTGKSQSSYAFVGSARSSTSSECYELTVDKPGLAQTGAIWSKELLNLGNSFEFEFTVNFGSNPSGADGVVMVMQATGLQTLGTGGLGIGFQGISQSLGIEFDTHFNFNMGDPQQDHISIIRDGVTDHRLNTSFASPVPISTTSNNIKDGRDHLVKVKWNNVTHLLQAYVDCFLRISQSIDLINDVFKGNRKVYWGFSGSTGSAGNRNAVCLDKYIFARDTFEVCPKDKITLVAGISTDNQYEWKPVTGLSDYHVRTPQLVATTRQLYTVSYVDRCSMPKTDSIYVNVKQLPTLSIGGNQALCNRQQIELNPTLTPDNIPVKFRWSTGDTTRKVNVSISGLYALRIMAENCSVSDSAVITFNPSPKLGVITEPVYDCPAEDSVRLSPRATGSDLQFIWTPSGNTDSTLVVNTPGQYSVTVTNKLGCSVEQRFTILDNCPSSTLVYVPNAFTPNGDGANDVFEWKGNPISEVRMSIYNRWGQVVFSTDHLAEFWNGTYQGQFCPSGTYAWTLDYRSGQKSTSAWFSKRGNVLLLR